MTSQRSYPREFHEFVDLRSDTVTRPTAEMFEAMQNAPLGDDVLGDDPTVMRLEELAADISGKAEAVFVPSGTMGNQIAIATHCQRGDAMLVEEEAHVLYYEVGGPAMLAQALTFTIPSRLGVMDPADIERRLTTRSLHTPGTTLLCLENTHNRAGGTVVPIEMMAAYRDIADRHGIAVHLDGARAFNAAAALNVSLMDLVSHVDTVSLCLSKGLRSPVGSVLCGPPSFIEAARVWRKRLGGGMRQAGILAACGIVSLTKMIERLPEDHARARKLANELERVAWVRVDRDRVQTNMVLLEVHGSAASWVERLKAHKVLALSPGANRLRLVLHADIDDAKLKRAVEAFHAVAQELDSECRA